MERLLRLLPLRRRAARFRGPSSLGGSAGGISSPIGLSSSTCQSWLNATIATAISITWSGTIRRVRRPSRSGGQGGVAEPVLRPVEPGRGGDPGEDRQDDRQRRCHGEDAAVPARDEEGEQHVDRDEEQGEDLAALQASPAAEGDHKRQGGRDQEEENDESPSALRFGLLPVRSPELVTGTDRSRFHVEQVYGLAWMRATATRRAAVRAEGLEPPRSFEHRHLKPARLPDSTTPAGPSILISCSGNYRCSAIGCLGECPFRRISPRPHGPRRDVG